MKNRIVKIVLGGFVLTTVCCSSGQAQLIDVMSNLAVQGQVNLQSTSQTKKALSMLRQNDVINQMNMMVVDIQTRMNHSYAGLSRNQVMFNLPDVSWNVGPVGTKQFFVELQQIDQSSCHQFVSSFPNAKEIWINGVLAASCVDTNTIKFIFD